MEERKFTYRDHLLGACQAFEVDLPWEDRFTKTDAFHGLCTNEQVGQARHSAQDQPDQPPPPPEEPEELAGLPREFIYERELAAYYRDPDAYRSKAGANLGTLLKMGEERRAKAAAVASTLDALTARQLERVPDLDISAALLQTLAEAERQCAAMGAAIDLRGIFRDIIGMDPSTIQELRGD